MQLLHDLIKNNFTLLQLCIQYEVLQRKPVFESYKTFCKAIGDDVMDYQEFEFWYMRFYNDQLDMDYDRKQNPEPLTLLELPVDVVGKVIKELDPIEKIVAHQVCKPIRYVIDEQNMDVDTVELNLNYDSACMKLDEKSIRYSDTEDGCLVTAGKKVNYEIEYADSAQTVLRDFEIILSNSKTLEHLKLDLTSVELDEFEEYLSSKIRVKKLTVRCLDIDMFFCILQYTEPGKLEKINVTLGDTEQPLDLISSTDQWRQAKAVEFYPDDTGIMETELRNFFHFSEFSVGLLNISRNVLSDLKDNIFAFDGFRKCEIYLDEPLNDDDVEAVFGENIELDEQFFIPIPGSNQQLMICYSAYHIDIKRI